MQKTLFILVGWFVFGVAASQGSAVTFSDVVVFGDSLSDVGNVFQASGGVGPLSPPYFEGRFSNGPVWVEHLAQQLGVAPLSHDLAGGTNYAWGGAETGSGPSTRGTPNISEQVTAYLNNPKPASNGLFVIWGGANDFGNAGVTNPLIPAANIASDVARLANAGAEQFLVPNLPPLGLTPGAVGTPSEGPLNALVSAFNAALDAQLDTLESNFGGIEIYRFDTFGLFLDIFADPGALGLTNITDQVYTGFVQIPGVIVGNPDEYAFWDIIHPSARMHEAIGNAALLAVVPEPVTAVLGMMGLAVVGLRSRRRVA